MNNSMLLLIICSVVVTSALLLFKRPFLYLLGCSDTMYPTANIYFTIYSLGTGAVLCGTGLNRFIMGQGYAKQGMVKEAIPISFFRKSLYVIAILLLPLFLPLEYIFYACPISDCAGSIFTLAMYFLILKKRLEVVMQKYGEPIRRRDEKGTAG